MKRTLISLAAGVALLAGCSSGPDDTEAETERASSLEYSSCSAAKSDGATPLRDGDPGWNEQLDRDGDGVACDDGATESTPATEVPPAVTAAPAVVSLPISLAEANAAVSISAIDLGPELVDIIDSRRMILDDANWTIVAQCDTMVDSLNVGAIQTDEWRAIQDAGFGNVVSENRLQSALTCP